MTARVRASVRALVDAVLVTRADAAVLTPVLTTMLQTAVSDFERYYDARHAANRVVDHDLLMVFGKQRKRR